MEVGTERERTKGHILQELILSLYLVDARNSAWLLRLSSRGPCSLSHLAGQFPGATFHLCFYHIEIEGKEKSQKFVPWEVF